MIDRLQAELASTTGVEERVQVLEELAEVLRVGTEAYSSQVVRQAFVGDARFQNEVKKWATEGSSRGRLAASLSLAMISPDLGKDLLNRLAAANDVEPAVQRIAIDATAELEGRASHAVITLDDLSSEDVVDILRQMLGSTRDRTRYLAIQVAEDVSQTSEGIRSQIAPVLIEAFNREQSVIIQRRLLSSLSTIAGREQFRQFLERVAQDETLNGGLRQWAEQALDSPE